MGEEKKKDRKILYAVIGVPVLLGAIYLGTASYFKNHFYYGTAINCISVSGKTEDEANTELAALQKSYALELQEKDGKKEKILAKEIGLKYTLNDEVKALINNQNPLKWIDGFLHKNDHSIKTSSEYDKDLLKKRVEALACLDESKVVEPKDAALKYNGKTYEIEKEINGNKVNKEALYDKISKAIDEGNTSINLEKSQCYYKPKYTAENTAIVDAKNTLNTYLSANITYDLGGRSEALNGSKINEWIGMDDGFKVYLNDEKVKAYVAGLAGEYDVIGRTIDFKSSEGSMVKVKDSNYRKIIDRSKETEALESSIKDGKTETRQPITSITNTPQISNTYVEVDLTKQCVWFYKNGALIVKGDVVTGNVSGGTSTPEGIYKIYYKQKDAVLKGQDYAAPVSYWMPFNGGIGIHDANWRTTFGGDIYKTSGSHGCINAPYNVAETIFNNIEAGTTVVCHY